MFNCYFILNVIISVPWCSFLDSLSFIEIINDEKEPADILHADKYISKIPCRSPYVVKNVSTIEIEHWFNLNELKL